MKSISMIMGEDICLLKSACSDINLFPCMYGIWAYCDYSMHTWKCLYHIHNVHGVWFLYTYGQEWTGCDLWGDIFSTQDHFYPGYFCNPGQFLGIRCSGEQDFKIRCQTNFRFTFTFMPSHTITVVYFQINSFTWWRMYCGHSMMLQKQTIPTEGMRLQQGPSPTLTFLHTKGCKQKDS